MLILGLDTSGQELVVALIEDGALVGGKVVPGPRHQDRIIELITEVAGDRLGVIDAVAVARGPGSHTGLRVGLSTASGIAFARRLPIYPLSSLAIAAHRAGDAAGQVLAVVGAGRGRAYIQPFDCDVAVRRPEGERRLENLADWDALGLPVASEPALLTTLPATAPGDRTGAEALAAAMIEAVGAGERVNYDQLTGDYGDL